jgi:orotate phosphoribosyltransferase
MPARCKAISTYLRAITLVHICNAADLLQETQRAASLACQQFFSSLWMAGVTTVAALAGRRRGRAALPVPFVPLIALDIPRFSPNQLPASLSGIPAIKLGSRDLKV